MTLAITHENAADIFSRARCLYSAQQVHQAVDVMAARISGDLVGRNPLVICLMNGGLMLTAELGLRMPFPLQMDYIHATRYRGESSGGEIEWKHVPDSSIQQRVVLLVDDIFDEGITLEKVRDFIIKAGAEAVYTAVLIDKQHDRKCTSLNVDYVALTAPDEFLVGWGMDYGGFFRNLDGIFCIDRQDY